MAEYLIQGETLVALGDQIRTLSGTEGTMVPSVMTSNVQSANDEVDAQSALIDQLSAALDGKAGGSGGSSSGSASLETCEVAVTMKAGIGYSYYTIENGIVTFKLLIGTSDLSATTFNIIKGSYFTWNNAALSPIYRSKVSVSGDIEILNANSVGVQAANTGGIAFKVNGAGTIDVAE